MRFGAGFEYDSVDTLWALEELCSKYGRLMEGMKII